MPSRYAADSACSAFRRAAASFLLDRMFSHSVCRWPFEATPLPHFAARVAELGISGIDLLHAHQLSDIEPSGLVCPITAAPDDPSGIGCIENAFNKPENHEKLYEIYSQIIPAAANAGIPQVICFSGNREGISDSDGIKNCADGLAPVVELAAKHDVTMVMELLNSKVDHPDYQCDHTCWGVDLCEALGSDRFRLLYDVYHMQVMEGDVIATIREFHSYISHYHTGGVPGRHELGADQELNYPAIVRAIAETGFDGYVAAEFIPTADDPFASLAEAVRLCSLG